MKVKTQVDGLTRRELADVLAMRVYAMRAQGLRWWRITELLGLQDETIAQALYKTAMTKRMALEERKVEWAREMQDERLDMVLEKTRHQLNQGDIQAARVWVRVEERRAKLWNLDLAGQPPREDVGASEIATLSDTALIRKAAEMMGLTVHDLARLSVQAAEEERAARTRRRAPDVLEATVQEIEEGEDADQEGD